MTRGGWLILSTVMALIAVAPPAGSQAAPAPKPSYVYDNVLCRYKIRSPLDWKVGADNNVIYDPATGTEVYIGPINAYSAPAGSAAAWADATAGEFCLQCLRTKLVWMDQFVQGSTSVIYTIAEEPIKLSGVIFPFYVVHFFFFTPSASPGDPKVTGFIRADLRVFVRRYDYEKLAPTIMDMIKSFEFQPSDCWHS